MYLFQGFIVKQYPAKFRLTIIQCFFSFIQSGILAIAMERNPSAWKLGWDFHLLSVAYCVGSLSNIFIHEHTILFNHKIINLFVVKNKHITIVSLIIITH